MKITERQLRQMIREVLNEYGREWGPQDRAAKPLRHLDRYSDDSGDNKVCPECRGSGFKDDDEESGEMCDNCQGEGWRRSSEYDDDLSPYQLSIAGK